MKEYVELCLQGEKSIQKKNNTSTQKEIVVEKITGIKRLS